MRNLEFRNKIRANQQKEDKRREGSFWLRQAKECYSYIEIGEDYGLREQCLHAVRLIRDKIFKMNKQFNLNLYIPSYWVI